MSGTKPDRPEVFGPPGVSTDAVYFLPEKRTRMIDVNDGRSTETYGFTMGESDADTIRMYLKSVMYRKLYGVRALRLHLVRRPDYHHLGLAYEDPGIKSCNGFGRGVRCNAPKGLREGGMVDLILGNMGGGLSSRISVLEKPHGWVAVRSGFGGSSTVRSLEDSVKRLLESTAFVGMGMEDVRAMFAVVDHADLAFIEGFDRWFDEHVVGLLYPRRKVSKRARKMSEIAKSVASKFVAEVRKKHFEVSLEHRVGVFDMLLESFDGATKEPGYVDRFKRKAEARKMEYEEKVGRGRFRG